MSIWNLRVADTAVDFKVRFKISLADAFTVAPAKENQAEIFTGDPKLKALEKQSKKMLAQIERELDLEREKSLIAYQNIFHRIQHGSLGVLGFAGICRVTLGP